MNGSFPDLGRYISILDRLMRMYYDHGLADFEIGWGQQFYVEYIYDHPGTSAPVSYTHLDVYKRQLIKGVVNIQYSATRIAENSGCLLF